MRWCRGLREMVGGGGGGGGGRETRRICRTRATRSECCPARKNGYSFSNVSDAHARFPAKRMAGVRGCGGAETAGGRENEASRRGGQRTRRGIEMTEREAEKEEAVDVEVEEEEVTLRLATGKKSMSSPPALALSVLSSDSTLCYLHRAK